MNTKEIRMIVTDLDGTLLSRFSTLSERAADDLRRLREEGYIVVICTGRPFYSIKRIIPEDLYDYAIAMNGQDIYLPHGNRHIHQPYLSKEQIDELLSFLDHYPVMAVAGINETSHYFINNKYLFLRRLIDLVKAIADKLQHAEYEKIEVDTDYSHIRDHKLGKLCFAGMHMSLKQITDKLDKEEYSITFVNGNWIEVQTAGINKGTALQKIMILAGVRKEEVIAFGDGENDIPMFETAGTAIAMKNAMPDVKKKADIEIGSFDHDAVAEWIEKNLL